MPTATPTNKRTTPSRRIKPWRLMVLLVAAFLIIGLTTLTPRPAQAFLGIPNITMVIGDIPKMISDQAEKIYKTLKEKIKVATDIAFKNSARQFLARFTQEAITSLATGGTGQKGLFLTDPKFYLRVGNAAAGDFVDEFTRCMSGQIDPNTGECVGGTTYGNPFSSARGKFLISRALRSALPNPLASCQTQCQTDFSAADIDPNGDWTMDEVNVIKGSRNYHQFAIALISYSIQKETTPEHSRDPSKPITCNNICQPPESASSEYIAWRVCEGVSKDNVPAEQCLQWQEEARNEEYATAQRETGQCLRDCQSGSAGFVTNAINQATATDIFTSIRNVDPSKAPLFLAQALSTEKSEVGQLLSAAATMSAAVRDAVKKEETAMNAGVIPRTSRVSGEVITPKESVAAIAGVPISGSGTQVETTYTGSGLADILRSVASFINSPLGRALTQMFKNQCGLNPDSCKGPSNAQSALGQLLFGAGQPTGIAGARLQFAGLGRAEILGGDPGRNEISVTDQLTSSGLVDAQFRTAIEEQLTVKEALDQGLLNPQKPFGFDTNGVQPREGYPYRALQYLRKFRVIPVGWELAAKYNYQIGHESEGLSLGKLTEQFSMCDQDDQHQVCSKSLKSCQDATQCQSDEQCGASPYCGLVDPNWVLKAPQTYCRRQGAGEEILSKEFVCDQDNVKGTGDTNALGGNAPDCVNSAAGPDIGRWVINRNPDTCADVQSCIAENEDGSCIAFGYCVQERQTFKFDGDQCASEYATCTSYTTSAGQSVSYLKNTLDINGCNADNAGCLWYCQDQNLTTGAWTCSETIGNKIHFTKNVKACSQSEVGCRQFIRTGNGTNWLVNSGFETFAGAERDSGGDAVYPGWVKNALQAQPISADDPSVTVNNSTAVALVQAGSLSQSAIDAGYKLYERSFIGSIRAKASSSCAASLTVSSDIGSATATINAGANWDTFAVQFINPPQSAGYSSSNNLNFTITLGGCTGLVIDNAQLEENTGLTVYKDYGAINNVYLSGARQSCGAEDVGCEKYTPVAGGAAVTGQVRNTNRCSEENVSCASYTLEPINSIPQRLGAEVNIVPARAEQCSAADVGCEEYTNLDEVARGGEGKEYFKSVRQCVKPGTTTQATYYSWVGDAKRGFLLRAYDLVKTNQKTSENGFVDVYGPCTSVSVGNVNTNPSCNDTLTSIQAARVKCTSAADMATNPDCAEYYDSELHVFYRLRSKTVTVTDDCHPYRNTVDQQDVATQDRIFYLATNENLSCSAAVAGCRAYTGNASSVQRELLRDDFESGATTNWVGGSPSSESVNLNGHSMYIQVAGSGGTAFTSTSLLKGQLTPGKIYNVSFTAAAASENAPMIAAKLGTADGVNFAAVYPFPGQAQPKWNGNITPSGPEWNQFTLGPLTLEAAEVANLALVVSGGDVYVDNIVLTEITDSIYLVQPTVPECPQGEIGCAAYRDRAGKQHFLKSFTRLCSEQVVGCEAMIDTQNSSSPYATTIKNVATPADRMVTMVYNPGVACSATAKGCSAYGRPNYSLDRKLADYTNVYLVNDPDRYNGDLCYQEEVFCQAYQTANGGAAFFKDPLTSTCDYRGGSWLITGTSYACPTVTPPIAGRPIGPSCSTVCKGQCNNDASRACVTNNDCLVGGTCQGGGDRIGRGCLGDSDCPNSVKGCHGNPATIGKVIKGASIVVGQCQSDSDCNGGNKCIYLAGVCPAEQNGCTEYRDPGDPTGCRVECPLVKLGGEPQYSDAGCVPTVCAAGKYAGKSCQTSDDCPGSSCSGQGLPGCRSYYYKAQSLEDKASECGGQVNLDIGCRPFYNTANPTLNFRGE